MSMPYYFVADSNMFLAVITGISLFMLFKNVKIKYNKFINTVASSVFGVLCIHANSDVMRYWLWVKVFNNVNMYSSNYLIIHAFGAVIIVYVVCTVFDNLRFRFIEKPIFNKMEKYLDIMVSNYVKLENRFLKFLKDSE